MIDIGEETHKGYIHLNSVVRINVSALDAESRTLELVTTDRVWILAADEEADFTTWLRILSDNLVSTQSASSSAIQTVVGSGRGSLYQREDSTALTRSQPMTASLDGSTATGQVLPRTSGDNGAESASQQQPKKKKKGWFS